MNKEVWLILVVLFATTIGGAQSARDSMNREISTIIKESSIPGLGVSIVSEKGLRYAGGFGLRDVGQQLSYDSLTIQPVASISKTMIAVALMKLVEEGKADLNTDINAYLPFKVVNPNFPDRKITLLHLATHTSGIIETNEADDGSYYIIDKKAVKSIFPKGYYKNYRRHLRNQKENLSNYLYAHLSQKGEKFKKNIFGKHPPGEVFSYTNVGASLAAYIVELISGKTFASFSEEKIFHPLGMKRTAWKKTESVNSNFATLYFQNGEAVPAYALNTYPSGGLHTTSFDMGLFLAEITSGFNGKGTLLSDSSYQFMLTNQLTLPGFAETRGVFWSVNKDGTNIGHNGAEIGTSCQLIFNPDLNIAFFMMVNISTYEQEALNKDFIRLLITIGKYAKSMN